MIIYCSDGVYLYKIILTPEILKDIKLAQIWIDYSPWKGELRIPMTCLWLNNQTAALDCTCILSNDNDPAIIVHDRNSDTLLYSGSLDIPDVFITKSFILTYISDKPTLDINDEELINKWLKEHDEKLKN